MSLRLCYQPINCKDMNSNLKTAKRAVVLMLLLFTSLSAAIAAGGERDVNFINSDLDAAKQRASAEGKLVFVDFYARWCTPCKWMDQTTFKDKNVVELLNENFIAVKMNIDETEGFEMKKRYEVQYLPTILIFNSNGQVVDRIEETLTSADLIQLLHRHNSVDNKRVIVNGVNASPTESQRTYQPEDDSFSMTSAEYNSYKDTKKSVYRVQTGVYEEYAGAAKMVANLRETFLEDIVVINDYRGDKVLFKVMLGQFSTLEEAESFRKILGREFDIEGIVN